MGLLGQMSFGVFLTQNSFTTAPVLTHWRPDLPIIIETDASNYALAAILSIPTLSLQRSSTMMFTTRNFWQFLMLLKYGGITLKVLLFLLMLLLTTRILNIFRLPKFCLGAKLIGPSFYPDST